MTILLILLILLIILVIIRLFNTEYEGFESGIPLNPTVIKDYKKFLYFYNTFCENWKKALVSSAAADITQEPLASPSDVSSSSSPTFTDQQLNVFSSKLSSQISQPLPQVCNSLPNEIDSDSLEKVIGMIPSDAKPYINALNWMNKKLMQVESDLKNSLSGVPPPVRENFEDKCQEVSRCLANNPEFAANMAQQSEQQKIKRVNDLQAQLMKKIIPFLSNYQLMFALNLNVILVKKTDEIKRQAESGELYNQLNISKGKDFKFKKEKNKLEEMKLKNPAEYDRLKKEQGRWLELKTLYNQIDSTL